VLSVAASSLAARAQEAPQPSAPPPPPQEVSGPEISMLIRGTLAALHHANATGNYTVLRELGTIDFQVSNSAARLTDLFREFRDKRFNLAPVVIFDAKLDKDPQLTTDGTLRLIGHFPTKPQEILFDLTFLYERGEWRISTLNVGARPAGDGDTPKEGEGAPQTPPLPPAKPTN
jgi:hypothetical protein